MAEAKIDRMLRKVAALLDKAEHPKTPPEEADSARKMADKLMLDYAIEEAMLDRSQPKAKQTQPVNEWFVVCQNDSHLRDQILSLAGSIFKHFRVRFVWQLPWDGVGEVKAGVVGFKSDIEMAKFMFVRLHMDLSGQLNPTPDPAKSLDENVYDLHAAAMSWRSIIFALNQAYRALPPESPARTSWKSALRGNQTGGDDLLPVHNEESVRASGQRLKTAYRRECKRRGEETVRVSSPVGYQRNVAEGYSTKIWSRLYAMRTESDHGSSALVLRSEDVEARFNDLYPPEDLGKLKPKGNNAYNSEARARGREAASRADLGTGNGVGGRRTEIG